MKETLDSPALSGRDLARARRREMSRTGGATIKKASSNPQASATRPARVKAPVANVADTSIAASVESSVMQSSTAPMAPIESTGAGTKPLSGRALSIARRAKLAKGGKSALPAKAKKVNQGRQKPNAKAANTIAAAPNPTEAAVASSFAEKVENTEKKGACCDACAEADAGSATEMQPSKDDVALDSLCDIIESSSDASANAASSVRAFCRDRRNTLSKKGKLGLSGKAGVQARKSLMRNASTSPLTARAMAKLRREDRNEIGRGDKPKSRPSGRVRPNAGEAPPKVEIGTTLSGQEVTGTIVEQSGKLTGVESGACRTVTGTEYLGAEQFETLCNSTPKPAAPKVGVSETGGGQLLTGSKTAASTKVTGDEQGSCRSVTGSEYLGAEHFGAFCPPSSMNKAKEKVVVGSTAKNLPVTGADEARDSAVTGSETGENQRVTGSEYSNIAPDFTKKRQAPAKVDFSHTAAGVAVSGGESQISGVTGDDQDVCRLVTGSEYISSERIQTACGASPQRSVAKVGEDSSRGGLSITGNLFDRSQNVTGNEPGTCQRVTGSQYGDSAKLGACDSRSSKVHEMHTSQGRRLTGTEGSPSPKLSGDDRGSCSAVTGSEYVSQEFFKQSCTQTPQPSANMTGMSRTWNNQVVSGVKAGHSQKTTGDEHGICSTVTGSGYAGRDQVAEFCSPTAVAQGERRLSQQVNVPTMPVSGMTPAVDGRMAGSFQRGQCQDVTGSPYQGQEDVTLCNSGSRHHLTQAPMGQRLRGQELSQPVVSAVATVEPYQSGFSVATPAKVAWQQRDNDPVHSSVYARRSSITGAANKAEGIISGTPEFRHEREIQPSISPMANPVAEAEVMQTERITGEGSESGTAITGDDWSRGGLVTGTEGLFSSRRNQTQQGSSVKRNNIGAHALKNRERPEAATSRVTGGSGSNGSTSTTGLVTLSGGAAA